MKSLRSTTDDLAARTSQQQQGGRASHEHDGVQPLAVGRTFVVPSPEQAALVEAERERVRAEAAQQAAQHAQGKVSRRQALLAGGMGALSLAMLVGAVSGRGERSSDVRDEQVDQLASARDEYDRIEAADASLISATDATRAMAKATTAARQVMSIQSSGQILALRAQGSSLPAQQVRALRSSLAPFFARDVPSTSLGPWYLLGSDATAAAGIGAANGFGSGVVWQMDVAQLTDSNSRTPVIWRAIARDGGDLLAIVRAQYEMTHEVFTTPHVMRTRMGAQAELVVSR